MTRAALTLAALFAALAVLRRPRSRMPAVPEPELPETEEEGLYVPMAADAWWGVVPPSAGLVPTYVTRGTCTCGPHVLCAAHSAWRH
jgi:hypothetical protein